MCQYEKSYVILTTEKSKLQEKVNNIVFYNKKK